MHFHRGERSPKNMYNVQRNLKKVMPNYSLMLNMNDLLELLHSRGVGVHVAPAGLQLLLQLLELGLQRRQLVSLLLHRLPIG